MKAQIKNYFMGGMDKDTTKDHYSNKHYIDSENMRLLTQDGESSGSMENIKGTIKKISFNFTDTCYILGSVTIGEYLVLFVYVDRSTPKQLIYCIKLSKLKNDDEIQLSEIDYSNEQSIVYSSTELDWGSNTKIKATSRYDNENIIKIYWIEKYDDGSNSSIRHLNIADFIGNSSAKYPEKDNLELLADMQKTKPSITSIITGNLPIGAYQYTYQLYNIYGSETEFAPFSDIVFTTQSSQNRIPYNRFKGGYPEENSGKGFTGEIQINTNGYNLVRVYSINYENNVTNPTVRVITEIEIDSTLQEQTVTFNDTGVYIDSSSIEDLLIADSSMFSSEDIETSGNVLFAANTKYEYFDFDKWLQENDPDNAGIVTDQYDNKFWEARAFRYRPWFETSGDGTPIALLCEEPTEELSLARTDGKFTGKYVDTDFNVLDTPYTLDKEHNAINRKNTLKYNHLPGYDFAYQTDGETLGGEGVNIKYYFRTEQRLLSTTRDAWEPDSIQCPTNNTNALIPYGSTVHLDAGGNFTLDERYKYRSPGYTNYSNTLIASKYATIPFDETERYGIQFIDSKGRKSFVKWIGDIFSPLPKDFDLDFISHYIGAILAGHPSASLPGGRYTDANGRIYDPTQYYMTVLFLTFEVRNVPDGIGWRIVRVPKTEANISNIAQGALQATVRKDGCNYGASSSFYGTPGSGDIFTTETSETVDNEIVTFIDTESSYKELENVDTVRVIGSYYNPSIFTGTINGIYECFNVYGNITSDNVIDYNIKDVATLSETTGTIEPSPIQIGSKTYKHWTNTAADRNGPRSKETILEIDPISGYNSGFLNVTGELLSVESISYGAFIIAKLKLDLTESDKKKIKNRININNAFVAIVQTGTFSNQCQEIVTFDFEDPSTVYTEYSSVVPSNIWSSSIGETIKIEVGIRNRRTTGALTFSDDLSTLPAVLIKTDNITSAYGGPYNSNRTYNTYTPVSDFVYNFITYKSKKQFLNSSDYPVSDISNNVIRWTDVYGDYYITDFEKRQAILREGLESGDVVEAIQANNRAVSLTILPVISRYNTGMINYKPFTETIKSIRNVQNRLFSDYTITYTTRTNSTRYNSYTKYSESVALGFITNDQYLKVINSNRAIENYNILSARDSAGAIPLNGGIIEQEKELYEYNEVYSIINSKETAVPKINDSSIIATYRNRIRFSDRSITNEIADGWLKFRSEAYKDVDQRYGAINAIIAKNKRLFFFQERAIGLFEIDKQIQIPSGDNTSLELGASAQVIDQFGYLTTTSGVQSKNHVVESEYAIYTIDSNNNAIYRISDKVEELSLTKGITSVLKAMVPNTEIINIDLNSTLNSTIWQSILSSLTFSYGSTYEIRLQYRILSELTDCYIGFDTGMPTLGNIAQQIQITTLSTGMYSNTYNMTTNSSYDRFVFQQDGGTVLLENVTIKKITDIQLGYDKEYKEVLFKINDSTLVFNELLNIFSGFYTITPELLISIDNILLTTEDRKSLYKHNVGQRNVFYDNSPNPSSITWLVNPMQGHIAVYDVLEFLIDIYNNNTVVNDNPTISTLLNDLVTIRVWNDYQDTGILDGSDLTADVKRRFRKYRLHKIRENTTRKNKLKDVYTKVELTLNNRAESTGDDYKYILHDLTTFFNKTRI